MFRGLGDSGEGGHKKKTIKPLIKFGYKDAKTLAKKKRPATRNEGVTRVQKQRRPEGYISTAAEVKIQRLCDLLQVGELDRARLTAYIIKLDPRCSNIELNSWSTSQLMTSNIVRTATPLTQDTKAHRKKKKMQAEQAEECPTLFWIFSIALETERLKKGLGSKKKDVVTLFVPSVSDKLSEKQLMSEYLIFKLWLVVRYVYTTVLSAAAEDPRVLVPIFIIKLDIQSTMGRVIREQLWTSYSKEVKDLKSTYRCSFAWK